MDWHVFGFRLGFVRSAGAGAGTRSVIGGAVLFGLALTVPARAEELPRSQPSSAEATSEAKRPTPAAPPNATPPDPATSESVDQVTPPVPLNTPVEIIAEADRHVEIVLVLVIDEAGHVTSARAESGAEPYASRAIESTSAWSFRPATQGGRPIPARIAFLVSFDPPPEPAPAPDGESARPAEPPRATAQATPIAEVVVLGRVKDPGGHAVTRAETRNLAGAFDDPLRSVEVLPGVSPILTGLPLFFVRGAPPGNVGYFIDGVRVPLLYHGFLGPSVIHPAFIDQIELFGGPAPARFGRYAGAIVDAKLAAPEGHWRGDANLRLLDAGGFVEAPFAGGRGYAMLGGRYSYTALLLSALSADQQLDYWDYQALVGYRLGRKDELSLFAFGAFDFADFAGSTGTFDGGTEFHRVDLRYLHEFTAESRVRVAATYGRDRSRTQVGYLADDLVASRVNYTYDSDDIIVRAGADVSVDDYDTEISGTASEPELYETLFPSRTDVSGGTYVEAVLFPREKIHLIPGLRADVFSSLGDVAFGVDPRLSVEYQLHPKLKASHSIGVAHQSPNFVPNVPGAQVGGLEGGLQESVAFSTSYEAELPWEVTGSVAFFVNGTARMSDPFGLTQSISPDETANEQRAFGRALGVEFFFKRPLSRRFGGLLSYTYQHTLRSYGNISTVPGYDRPHVLNVAGTYDFGRHWQGSAKFAIASGIPGRVTTLDGFVYDTSDRSRPLVRLDLKLQKRWYVSEHFFWGIYGEVLNATFSPSVARRPCTVSGCEDEGTAPIVIPNIGVEASWN